MIKKIVGAVAVMIVAGVRAEVSLPECEYADTETVTNVAFRTELKHPGEFNFSLSFSGTASNNVEAAFGVDSNSNGVLSVSETEFSVAWDCGKWVMRKCFDKTVATAENVSTNDCHSFVWKSRINTAGVPVVIDIADDGQPLFAGISASKPAWTYSRNWNMIRLTGRGVDVLNDRFEISVKPDGFYFFLR